MIVSHIFPPFDVVEKEGPKMFQESNFFSIFAEESSGRAESNNVSPVSRIQKGKKAEGGPLLAELFHT